MNQSQNPAGTAHIAPPFAFERASFKLLVLSNPNHFGNAPGLGPVVTQIEGSVAYEALLCLGLNPAADTLEAVIEIKQSTGYDSGPCDGGSTEYVRFYAQTGTGWDDLGLAAVNVYNLAGSNLPVSYALAIPFDGTSKFCWVDNIVTVRAILSWEVAPPANTPDFVPVWGNTVDAQVQIAPIYLEEIPITSLLGSKLIDIDAKILDYVDLSASLPAKPAPALTLAALKSHYAGTKVPPHRWGFSTAQALLAKPLNQALKIGIPPVDIGPILSGVAATSGDTYYEQLTCAGYNPQTQQLEAVVQINQNSGYNGGPCTAGSTEFVAFYGYFGGGWNALGVAGVNVYDLGGAARFPVNYAVFRLSPLLTVACENLLSIPLRAILSWQQQPTGPDFVPVWGNVLNTNIQPQIGAADQTTHTTLMRIGDVSIFASLGGIAANPAFGGDYLANATNVAGDCTDALDSPFGGNIGIEGQISPKVDGVFDPVTGLLLPGAYPIIYQAFITYPGVSAPVQLLNPFNIEVYPPAAPWDAPDVTVPQTAQPAPGPVTGQASSALYYTYYETDTQAVDPRTLAWFPAGGLDEGNYAITIIAYGWDGSAYVAAAPVSQSFYVYNGYAPGKGGPLITLTPTSVLDCGNVTVGETITGNFTVADEFFGGLSFEIVPAPQPIDPSQPINTGVTLSVPVNYPAAPTTGTSGTFSIDTTNWQPCGYGVLAIAGDRALRDTECYNHQGQASLGFCVVAAD
jgi:hypothetical protein